MKRLSANAVDWLVTTALMLATLTWILAVEGRQGFGRDEGQYMRAGERYWGWFEELGVNISRGQIARSFDVPGIDRFWSDNAPDHPVIMKTLYGLSWRAFHRCTCTGPERGLHPIPIRGRHITLPLFARESTAFRLPAILFAAFLVGMVYRFGRSLLPRPAAAAAAVLTLAQPHYFFHAPIACFDAPITTMAFAVGFAYWKSLRSPRWGIIAGVLFGIALGVKHNAWLMPIFLVGHYLWMRRRDFAARRIPRPPLAFVSMLVLGPIIFFLHWPWLWNAPVARTRMYINRHLQHEHYNFEYLGKNWNNPPTTTPDKALRATAPFVETGLTVPATTLALAVFGIGVLIARRKDDPRVAGRRTGSPQQRNPQLAAARGRRRSGAGCVPAGPDAGPAGGAGGPVDADLRGGQTLHDGDAVPRAARRHRSVRVGLRVRRGAAGDPGPVSAPCPRGARRAGLPAGRGRDAALAPGRPVALQHDRGWLRGRRDAGDEPPVLGLCGPADAGCHQPGRAREPVRCTGTT